MVTLICGRLVALVLVRGGFRLTIVISYHRVVDADLVVATLADGVWLCLSRLAVLVFYVFALFSCGYVLQGASNASLPRGLSSS